VDSSIVALPEEHALADLVDMTHLRWLLLRPSGEWADDLLPLRRGLAALPITERVLERDGWELLRVTREPRHPEWYAAIATRWSAESHATVLGTPLAPIPDAAARALTTAKPVPLRLLADRIVSIEVQAMNRGTVAWPAAVPSTAPPAYTMRLVIDWTPFAADRDEASTVQEFALARDVPPGDRVAQRLLVKTPAEPGTYDLRIRVRQIDGARFDAPGSSWHRQRVDVVR
jgi:hypothetical protein